MVTFRYLLWFSKVLPWVRKPSVFENQPHNNPGPQFTPCEELIGEKGLWNALGFLSGLVCRAHSPWKVELIIDVKKCARTRLRGTTVWSHSQYQSGAHASNFPAAIKKEIPTSPCDPSSQEPAMRLETLLIQTDTLSGTKSRALPQLHWLASPTRENTAHRWAAVPLTGHREKWQGQRLVKVFSFIKNWQLHLSFSKLGKFLWFGCGFGFFFFSIFLCHRVFLG